MLENLVVSLLHLKFLGGVQQISLGELLSLLLPLKTLNEAELIPAMFLPLALAV